MLRILLAVVVLAGLCAWQMPAQPVRADPLSDLREQQARLANLIAQQQKQLAGLQAQQQHLQGQITATQHSLATIADSLADLDQQVGSLRGQLSEAEASYQSLASQLGDADAQLRQLEAEEQAKQGELDRRQEMLAAHLVAAYKADQTPLLTQLLTAHSLTDVLSDVSYYLDAGEADKVLADQIEVDQQLLSILHDNVSLNRDAVKALTDEAAERRQELDAEAAQLADAQAQLEALRARMEAQLEQQRQADAKLARDKAKLAAAIRSNGQALTDLGQKIDQLIAKEGDEGGIPSDYSGTLAWPMGGVVTQEFGCTGFPAEPRVGSCAHFHEGIDLAAPCGTQIRAAAPGVVVFVGYNPYDTPPQAWLVIIAHSTSLNTWYAHMKARAPTGIRAGAHVSAGQLIGWEASTGHSTGCHLHWAVRLNGKFVNPRLFV
jgi:murein DD-endopeptidase MepM/ murein hydrolase activator NlpD